MGENHVNELLFASASASANFAQLSLEPYRDHLRSISSFVTPEMNIMHWHEFGDLEGPGWAANAVGGAHLLYKWGRYCADEYLMNGAISLLQHVLEHGFVHPDEEFIWPYFDLGTQEFCWNYTHGMDWLCPGSLAKIGVQLLDFAADLQDEVLSHKLIHAAEGLSTWLYKTVPILENGWLPRRITPIGELYQLTPDGSPDPIFDHSGDGLFILQLWSMLASRGDSLYRIPAKNLGQSFIEAGGYYGSINHDTYDDHESVAYACAFRIFRQAADLLSLDSWRNFAYQDILPGLTQFRMNDDRHGLPTKGLFWMEKSWNTAYMWENAESAQAYMEAWDETGEEVFLFAGLGILEAAALHHHGKMGFLTEGVDWDNHVTRRHHVAGKLYEDIQYTEPLLNNLHILLPTLSYFEITKTACLIRDKNWAINFVGSLSKSARQKKQYTKIKYQLIIPVSVLIWNEAIKGLESLAKNFSLDGIIINLAGEAENSNYTVDGNRLGEKINQLKKLFPRVFLCVPVLNRLEIEKAENDTESKIQYLVDENGLESNSAVCLISDYFLNGINWVFKKAAEMNIDGIWVGNDFRYLLHDVSGYTCFCPLHISEISNRTGIKWTRQELLQALKHVDNDNLRQAWFDLQEDSILSAAKVIEHAVHKENPKIRIGLVSTNQSICSAEGRHMDRLLRIIAGTLRPILVTGLSIHQNFRDVKDDLSFIPSIVREYEFIGDDIERFAWISYSQSASNILNFEKMVVNGINGNHNLAVELPDYFGKIDRSDSDKNELFEYLGKNIIFLNALISELSELQQIGINILDHENYARNMSFPNNSLMDWVQSRPWEPILLNAGLPIGKPTGLEVGRNGPFFISGLCINAYSDYDLSWFFREGAVVDPLAVEALIKRGWGEKLGIRKVEPLNRDVYEVMSIDNAIVGKDNKFTRIAHSHRDESMYSWDFIENRSNKLVFTELIGEFGEKLGPAVVGIELNERVYSQLYMPRIVLLPFSFTGKSEPEHFLENRRFWGDILEWVGGESLPCRVLNGVKVHPYVFCTSEHRKYVFTLVNSSDEGEIINVKFGDIDWHEKNTQWYFLNEAGDWIKQVNHDKIWKIALKPHEILVIKRTNCS